MPAHASVAYPPPPAPVTPLEPRPSTVRRVLGWIGVTIAGIAVVPGLAVSWIGTFLGNCAFIEGGPIDGASRFELSDVLASVPGLLIAVVPWLLVWWLARERTLRVVAKVVIGAVLLLEFVVLWLPQITDGEAAVASMC